MRRMLLKKDGIRFYVSVDRNRSTLFIYPFESDIEFGTPEMRAFLFFAKVKAYASKIAVHGWRIVGARGTRDDFDFSGYIPCISGAGRKVKVINTDEQMSNGVFSVFEKSIVCYYSFFYLDENNLGGDAYSVWLLGCDRSFDVRFSLSPAIASCDCQRFHAESWCNHLTGIATMILSGRAYCSRKIKSQQVLEAIQCRYAQ